MSLEKITGGYFGSIEEEKRRVRASPILLDKRKSRPTRAAKWIGPYGTGRDGDLYSATSFIKWRRKFEGNARFCLDRKTL